MTNAELIAKTASILGPTTTGGRTTGDVRCALLSERGNPYLGVSVDTLGALGFCAEQNVIGSMIVGGWRSLNSALLAFCVRNLSVGAASFVRRGGSVRGNAR